MYYIASFVFSFYFLLFSFLGTVVRSKGCVEFGGNTMLNELLSPALIADKADTFFRLIFEHRQYMRKNLREYENNFGVHCSRCSFKSNLRFSVVKLKKGL